MRSDVNSKHLSLKDQKSVLYDRLCLAWEGGDWLPSDVFAYSPSPSTAAMQCMDKATTIAQSRITNLSFLWGPNGPLRVAFESSGQKTSSDFCNIVNNIVDDWECVSDSTMQRRQKTAIEAERMLKELHQTQYNLRMSMTNVEKPSRSLVPEDQISGVHRDLNSIKQQIDEAYCRKMSALLVTVTSQFQLRELSSLFLGDTEGPTSNDRKMTDASLEPTQTNPTQTQRVLLESEISKATQEAEIAEADINNGQIDLQTMMVTAQELVDALEGVC